MTDRQNRPRTEAGRRLLEHLDETQYWPGMQPADYILAIEAEAAAGPSPAPSTTPQARDEGLREAALAMVGNWNSQRHRRALLEAAEDATIDPETGWSEYDAPPPGDSDR